MSSPSLFSAVITTIQKPTKSVLLLAERMAEEGGTVLVLGDKKGPFEYPVSGPVELFTLESQNSLPFSLVPLLPVGHYTRKNIGYLVAMQRKTECLYETDDDNAPLQSWSKRSLKTSACTVPTVRYCNAYRAFNDARIWPRGFPLDHITDSASVPPKVLKPSAVEAPIQQGLADGSPDVDAIWRLTDNSEFFFTPGPSIHLPKGTWCPFNSQSTWWWPVAYPLLYLPSFCTFRMTDIWRSFIAQRCLWELGYGMVFHAPEVLQERNEHNLLRDFEDEIPGYRRNGEFMDILTSLSLASGAGALTKNLLACYEALVAKEFFPAKELDLVKAWITDVEKLTA